MTNFFARFFTKIALALRSKTCWTVATFFAVHLPQVRDQIPLKFQPLVDVALALLTMYFRLNPSETLNNTLQQVNEQE